MMLTKLAAGLLAVLFALGVVADPLPIADDTDATDPTPTTAPPVTKPPAPDPAAESVDRAVASLAAGTDRDAVYAQLRYELARLDVVLTVREAARR